MNAGVKYQLLKQTKKTNKFFRTLKHLSPLSCPCDQVSVGEEKNEYLWQKVVPVTITHIRKASDTGYRVSGIQLLDSNNNNNNSNPLVFDGYSVLAEGKKI